MPSWSYILILVGLALSPFVAGCASDGRIEGTSLLGEPLRPAPPSDEARIRMEQNLADAQNVFEANPHDEGAIIWYGRRLAYLGRYRDAIDVYTNGLATHPDSYKLRRHRGHRFITIRKLDRAVDDLTQAAELMRDHPDAMEPDGIPNALNQPRSTDHFNIWYHLGLAHYLNQDYDAAAMCYDAILELPLLNDDLRVATTHWLYMTLRRDGRVSDATDSLNGIHDTMDIVENSQYHDLCLLYRGERTLDELGDTSDGIESATLAYGIGNWHFYNGDLDGATAVFESIVAGDAWPAFGHIAAEADLAMMRRH